MKKYVLFTLCLMSVHSSHALTQEHVITAFIKTLKTAWLVLEMHDLWQENEKGKLFLVAAGAVHGGYQAENITDVKDIASTITKDDLIPSPNVEKLCALLKASGQTLSNSLEHALITIAGIRVYENIKKRQWFDAFLYGCYLMPLFNALLAEPANQP